MAPAPMDAAWGEMSHSHQHPQPMLWDLAPQLRDQWAVYYQAAERMNAHMQLLQRAAEHTRQTHQRLVQERDALRAQLQSAEQRLSEVQRIVGRYTVVAEPVVASDGYTYERRTIQQYLDDCERTGLPAVSQQTKEPLQPQLVPNQSLRKLVDLLKNIKPQELPPLTKEAPTAPPQEISPQHQTMLQHMSAAPFIPSPMPPGGPERLHPCVRVYGYCNYKESCAYARYPYEACLSHLKGKCRFGMQCHELHIDFKGPFNQQAHTMPRRMPHEGMVEMHSEEVADMDPNMQQGYDGTMEHVPEQHAVADPSQEHGNAVEEFAEQQQVAVSE